jgi:NADPH:quinone reductase-like Zn-dependent oxidoreductase
MLNTRVIVNRYGGPEVLEVVQEPLRMPKKGEIRVKVESAGVALADIMRREGVYPLSPTPPFTPGYDAVGIVDELGDDVQQFSKGEKVAVLFNGTGGYAAYVYAKVDELVTVPAPIEGALAVAVILNYVTAYQMLHRIANVAEGESVLIHGASGGVGTALSKKGRFVGYGYTSILQQGDQSDWVNHWTSLATRKTTDGGNPIYLYSITALKKERLDWFREDVQFLFSLVEKGKINPFISHRIPLREAAYAQENGDEA